MTACRFLSRPAKAKKSALKSRAKTSTNSQTTYAGVWHLGVGDEYEGTYCTRMNPLARIDLAGVKLHYRNGGYLIVPRDGAEVSIFMPHQIARRRPPAHDWNKAQNHTPRPGAFRAGEPGREACHSRTSSASHKGVRPSRRATGSGEGFSALRLL